MEHQLESAEFVFAGFLRTLLIIHALPRPTFRAHAVRDSRRGTEAEAWETLTAALG